MNRREHGAEMKPLDAGYAADVDSVDKNAWHDLLIEFDDASFFQTWSYGAVSWGERALSHLLLRKDGRVVAGVQLRLLRIPMVKAGVAYVTSGPMWRRKSDPADRMHLRNMIRALYNEYAVRRRLYLQILPRTFFASEADIRDVYREEAFAWRPDQQRTIFLDLTPPLEVLKQGTRRKWRQTLNRAGKQPFEIVVGAHEENLSEATRIIEEMKARKRYVEYGEMARMIDIHKDLPEALRLVLALCKYRGEPVAVLGWFPAGTVGLPLIAATGDKGLELSASYPLWWKMIEFYKSGGSACCDLGGVNAERNRGGYLFKIGLAGEKAEVRNHIGQFEACESLSSSVGFRTAFAIRSRYRAVRVWLSNVSHRLRHSFGAP